MGLSCYIGCVWIVLADESRAISSVASLPEVTLWRPIPEMTREDADVSLIFVIGNSISYLNPVDDPLFAAHRRSLSDDQTIYLPDYPAGALGCTEQVRPYSQ